MLKTLTFSLFILFLNLRGFSSEKTIIEMNSVGWSIYGNEVGIFAAPGDTLLFNWISGNHFVQVTEAPPGVTPFSFVIDIINPTFQFITQISGEYKWTSSSFSGTEIIHVYPANQSVRYFEFDDGGGVSAQYSYVVGTSNPNTLHILDSILLLPYGSSTYKPMAVLKDGPKPFNGSWDWHIPVNQFLLRGICPEAFDFAIDSIEGVEQEIIDQGGVCPISTLKAEVTGTVGIQPTEESSIKAYPNPFTKGIRIEKKGPSAIELIDLYGRIIFKERSNSSYPLDLYPDLENGIYFLRVSYPDGKIETLSLLKI